MSNDLVDEARTHLERTSVLTGGGKGYNERLIARLADELEVLSGHDPKLPYVVTDHHGASIGKLDDRETAEIVARMHLGRGARVTDTTPPEAVDELPAVPAHATIISWREVRGRVRYARRRTVGDPWHIDGDDNRGYTDAELPGLHPRTRFVVLVNERPEGEAS